MARCFWMAHWVMWALLPGALVAAEVTVVDDAGQSVRLSAPAARIVSLSPHSTELLFAAGAGAKVVGVMEGSDYPPEAKKLPRVGSASGLDLEAILARQPDLVVAWQSGNAPAHIARLRALGVPVFLSEPGTLEAVATSLERLGVLAGTTLVAKPVAHRFRQRVQALREQYAQAAPVRVFYQIWDAPLMTVNDTHVISDVLRMCGGVNVFGSLGPLVPSVSREAVIAANPAVIASSRGETSRRDWRADWQSFGQVRAVARQAFCETNPDWISRQGPRLIEAAQALCACIDAARAR